MKMQKGKSVILTLFLVLAAVLIGGAVGFVLFSVSDLPEVRQLEEYKPSITSRLYSDNKKLLAEFFLEYRTPVALADVPDLMVRALIATEDARFFSHRGLDWRGIARAMYRNIRARKVLEGGSTITQQLAKVLFLTPERSYARKLKEMALALRIEQHYTKQEILSFYFNQTYFGSGAYGIESAAQVYFGKRARDLSVAECALLAGLPRSPKYYSPFKSPESARARRAYVLNRMTTMGVITPAQADEARKEPLPESPSRKTNGPAPYFVEYVRQKVEERFGANSLYAGGLNIFTSLNDDLQRDAEQAVATGLLRQETRKGKKNAPQVPLQAALVAIEPATGRILAMVGGRDFGQSQFNRAWQALRQPGSAFKPFIYAAAIDRGYGASDILEDAPLTIKVDKNKNWSPENFSKTYQGPVTMRTALAQSLNVPTVRLLDKIGVDEAIRYAKKLGVASPLTPYLSLALGSSDVTLLELTAAYNVFADHGMRVVPVPILSITDSAGRVLYANDSLPEQVIKPETAYLTTNLLRGVIDRGTGWKARELGRPAAGKTGTTNDFRDAWFVGYTPNLVAGVWVGYDDHRSIGAKETGARAALPIWLEFMKTALDASEPVEFTAPEGIIFKQVDPRTGLLSSEHCPQSIREAFVPGTEPRKYCDEAAAPAADLKRVDEAPAAP
jgi:penicillin-binding protein 1A